MAKATHRGTCQCCGALQKLPGGKLSTHGYKVEWHSFQGVCRGTNELPYEQSCDLIKSFIEAAKKDLKRLQDWQADLRNPATEAKAWINFYGYPLGRHYKSGYFWAQAEIQKDERGPFVVNPHGSNGEKKEYFHQHCRIPYTVNRDDFLAVATHLNSLRADALDTTIARCERYITWQQERVDRWELRPLYALTGKLDLDTLVKPPAEVV